MGPNLPTDDPDDPSRLAEAQASVATAITVTGRQVPHELERDAAALLASIWTVSARHGIQPEDWAAVAALPTTCIDVLVAVKRRPRSDRPDE